MSENANFEGNYGGQQPPQFQQPYNPYQQPVYKPSTHLVWAILTTLFCCLPFGIVAIVKASQVDTLWFSGRHVEAIAASESAKKWSIISAVSSIAISLIYFIYIILVAAGTAGVVAGSL